MKNNANMGVLGSATSWVCTIVQTNEIFQFVMLILSILSTLFTLAYTIYKWYNKAKEDGKITKDEIENLADNVSEVLKDKGGHKNE